MPDNRASPRCRSGPRRRAKYKAELLAAYGEAVKNSESTAPSI